MSIEYLDPRAEPGLAADPYDLRMNSKTPGITIGLLANGFADSALFLEELGVELEKRLPEVSLLAFGKDNATVVADDELLDAITDKCQAVVTAYGHWGSCTSGTVRDGINLARRGVPATCLLTKKFREQGDFTARAAGMPDIPRIVIPHPVAGSGLDTIRRVAGNIVERVIESLEGGEG